MNGFSSILRFASTIAVVYGGYMTATLAKDAYLEAKVNSPEELAALRKKREEAKSKNLGAWEGFWSFWRPSPSQNKPSDGDPSAQEKPSQ